MKITPANATIDVYISRGQDRDPNNFVHDFAFKAIEPGKSITLNVKKLGLDDEEGFAMSIFVNAIDEAKDKLQDASITVSMATATSAMGVLAASSAVSLLLTVFALIW